MYCMTLYIDGVVDRDRPAYLLTGDHFPSRSGGRSFSKRANVSSTGNDESTGGKNNGWRNHHISRGLGAVIFQSLGEIRTYFKYFQVANHLFLWAIFIHFPFASHSPEG